MLLFEGLIYLAIQKHNVFLMRNSYLADKKPPVKYFRDEGFQTWSSPQTSRHLPLSNTRFYSWHITSAHLMSGCLSHVIFRECTSSPAVSVQASPPQFNSIDKVAHDLLISPAGKKRRSWLWWLQFSKYRPTQQTADNLLHRDYSDGCY